MKPPPVHIEPTAETRALLGSAKQWPVRLQTNLRKTLDHQNELTVGHIVQMRATGKGPFPPDQGKLGVVSSRYRRSVRPAKAVVSASGIDSAIGSNVAYAGAHEFGVDKVVPVKQHRMKNAQLDIFELRGGRQVFGWERAGAGGRGKRIASGTSMVRSHSMHMKIPARAPIRRGIEDRVPQYRDAMGGAIVSAFNPAP